MQPAFLSAGWYAPLAKIHLAQLVDRGGTTLVSFYEDEAKRRAGRRTEMRVGRYVRRFSGGKLKDEDVERIAAASDVKLRGNRVKITQDPDEIEAVYRNGPRSCMTPDGPNIHTGGLAATRVYAGPDLALAYLGEPENASARCVVWPKRKLCGPIYGDVSRMRLMLQGMGYQRGAFEGAPASACSTTNAANGSSPC